MVVHPAGFSDQAMYAIDQFVLRGGHAIVFVDPMSEVLNNQSPGQQDLEKGTSNLPPLFTAWGVDFDQSKIVGDGELAQQVQVAGPAGPQVTGYLAWMRMLPANFNADDPVTGNLQQLNIATAGALKHRMGATTTFTPLLQSSSTAALIDTIQIRVTQRPQDLLRRFEPTGERFTIAARVSGPVMTAFPNGAPPPAPEAPPVPGAAPPPPPPPTTPLPEQLKETADINVIVVADTDLLDDRFWVNVQNLLGQRIAIPTADNGAMVQNFVENMMGSNDLISLRTRERPTRPFVLVDNLRRQAESQFLAEERALQDRVTQTEASLRALQGQGGDENPTGPLVLSAEQQKQVDQFRQDLIQSRQSLRQVQANLRRDVENLGTALAVLNIAAVPVLVAAAAIGLAVLRNRRRSRARGM
jgi:ABC-type uncharacterized transport system involved in gliding motility auxiliary subunit